MGLGLDFIPRICGPCGPYMDFPTRICGPYGPYMVFLQEFMDIEVHIRPFEGEVGRRFQNLNFRRKI